MTRAIEERLIEYLSQREAIPLLAGVFTLIVALFADTSYFFIEHVSLLLFYAVLVSIGTRTWGQREFQEGMFEIVGFLFLSVGAVSGGYMIEYMVGYLSGNALPAQFVGLSLLAAGIYVNLHRRDDWRGILLWRSPHERYLLLIPSTWMIGIPILLEQFNSLKLLWVGYLTVETSQAFLVQIIVGLVVGVLFYLLLEEGFLENLRV